MPSFRGTYYERKNFVDTLMSVMAEEEFYSKKSVRNSLQEMKYNADELISLLARYNAEYPEVGAEIKYRRSRFGKIYFGFTVGDVKPIKDYFNYDGKKINASNTLIYNIFAIIPNYGKNRHVFYKVGFNQVKYQFTTVDLGYTFTMNRQLTSIAIGIRYAALKGYFRPYAGWAMTYTAQKAGNGLVSDGFPMIFELGGLVPVKKLDLLLQANFSPILSEQACFQYFSYSAGLMF